MKLNDDIKVVAAAKLTEENKTVNNICQELRILFKSIDGYNCFACSPNNKIGLNLNIVEEKDCFSAIIQAW